ncbi:hypothetical protein AJ79_02209 [Helicocarpus griseus UAMH5409]|uniref:Protein kinase activator n=1 Tax=Helicocarpus griseus UAMH5409 TaxID=1447875 RepID=A0A2B7Y4Q0_9EURO|nr:hypothetical protein AJ79_02209 [Helicocarpus griseus UAMH5409]
MATFFQSVVRLLTSPPCHTSRQGFGRGSNKNNNNNNNSPRVNNGAPTQSPTAYSHSSGLMNSPSISSTLSVDSATNDNDSVKYFFQEKYAPLNVKGNFLTLCACPKNVELGEWLAHQIVEQNRLLHGMLQVIQEINGLTGLPICNEHTCPTMSAGRLTYTWLVDGRAARISAPKFINRVEKWIVSKIHDPVMFPTESTSGMSQLITNGGNSTSPNDPAQDWIGKASGFPQTFYKDCQGIMKQMFRCYAHLYHGHWENPFFHINKHEVLNMCFVHFVTVAKYYKLVADKEMEPMQPLIDIYVKQEKIPPEALAGHWAQQPSTSTTASTASSN